MSLALVAIVLAIGAGAVVAVSTREPAAAAIGLTVALAGSALLSDPLPAPAILGARFAAALLAASLVRWAALGAPRQFSPLGWPAEAFLATAGAIAGLGLAIGLDTLAVGAGGPVGGGIGVPDGGGLPVGGPGLAEVLTAGALIVAAGTGLLALAAAALVHGEPGMRRAMGLVLVTQAILVLRAGIAPAPTELEEIARAALLVAVAACGGALARATVVTATSEDAR